MASTTSQQELWARAIVAFLPLAVAVGPERGMPKPGPTSRCPGV